MKTGKPIRLSEKLNIELETMRVEHAALMASQLKTFRRDLMSIANAAQRTIETDTRRFQKDAARLYQTQLNSIRRWLTVSPWLISGLILAGVVLMMAGSYFWTLILTRSELTSLGLTRIEQAGQTWLTLDPDRVKLNSCKLPSRAVYCIEILEE